MRGEFGLPKTYWLFNWVVGIVTGIILEYLRIQTESSALAQIGTRLPLSRLLVIDLVYVAYLILHAILIVYSVIAMIGIWRAANAYDGWRGWAILAKISVVVGVALTVFVAIAAFVVIAGS